MNIYYLENATLWWLYISLIQVGRLPFLPSSNLQMEVLTGRYLDIGFEDILNPRDLSEVGVQPHAVMERSLGLL